MTKAELQRQALNLPERDRLQLAEELWASVSNPNAYSGAMALPRWQEEVLDQRLADLEDSPDEGTPWETVRERIFSKGS
jgi:putative addiction module component (TIGR02574 family)